MKKMAAASSEIASEYSACMAEPSIFKKPHDEQPLVPSSKPEENIYHYGNHELAPELSKTITDFGDGLPRLMPKSTALNKESSTSDVAVADEISGVNQEAKESKSMNYASMTQSPETGLLPSSSSTSPLLLSSSSSSSSTSGWVDRKVVNATATKSLPILGAAATTMNVVYQAKRQQCDGTTTSEIADPATAVALCDRTLPISRPPPSPQKQTRSRSFSKCEIELMEAAYHITDNPGSAMMKLLVQLTGLKKTRIRSWFRIRRNQQQREEEKRENTSEDAPPTAPNTSKPVRVPPQYWPEPLKTPHICTPYMPRNTPVPLHTMPVPGWCHSLPFTTPLVPNQMPSTPPTQPPCAGAVPFPLPPAVSASAPAPIVPTLPATPLCGYIPNPFLLHPCQPCIPSLQPPEAGWTHNHQLPATVPTLTPHVPCCVPRIPSATPTNMPTCCGSGAIQANNGSEGSIHIQGSQQH